jgi:signal transduction histidine kinase/ActR/RegA family two-component response regulator
MVKDKTIRLDTVEVPEGFKAPFEIAQDFVNNFFDHRVEDPTKANIEIQDERYILVRAASMSVDFFETVKNLYSNEGEEEARNVAWNMLFDIAHAIGRADARNFHEKMNVKEPLEKLSAGPIHFAHSGWAFVRILPESVPNPDESFFLVYDHPFSFESHAWLQHGKRSNHPVCVMNAGYSSGWCEESFGLPLVAAEIMCKAKGDEDCRFVMAAPWKIESFISNYLDQAPELAQKVTTYEIPGFFRRKKLEEERARMLEELSKARDDLELRIGERTAELEQANLSLKREITERRLAEEELFKSRQLKSLGVLAGGLAHDFNNILTGILGNISVARKDESAGADILKRLEEAENACQMAKLLANRLLTFAKGGTPVTEPTSIAELVKETANFSLAGSKALANYDLPEDLWPVEIDRGQISQVIYNLVKNAEQAMPEGGTIRIDARNMKILPEDGLLLEDGVYLKISIRDEGRGIPEEILPLIFDPYFTDKPGGTGLGLTSALSIVKNHSGTITVDSPKGGGATISVYLPASPDSQPVVTQREGALPRGKGRILVMDDSEIIIEVVDVMLRRLGYEPVFAKDGASAIEIFKESIKGNQQFDAVIMDLTIPGGVGGKDAIKEVLAIDPQAKVIVASGYADDPIMSNYRDHGFRGVITKPFELYDLGAALQKVLSD